MTLSSDALTTIVACEQALGITAGDEDDFLTRLIESVSARIKRYCNRTFYYEEAIAEYVKAFGTTNLQVSRRPVTGIDSITYDGATVSSGDYKCVGYDFANAGVIYNSGGWYWPAMQIKNIARDRYPGSEDPLYLVTYDAGWKTPEQSKSGSITAVADLGGGEISITSARHLLSTGDSVTQSGTTSYNDTYTVTVIDGDTYKVTETFVADETGTWTQNNYTRDLPYDLEQACIDFVAYKYHNKGKNPAIKSEKLLSWAASYDLQSADDGFADIPATVRSVLDAYRNVVIE